VHSMHGQKAWWMNAIANMQRHKRKPMQTIRSYEPLTVVLLPGGHKQQRDGVGFIARLLEVSGALCCACRSDCYYRKLCLSVKLQPSGSIALEQVLRS